MLKVLSCLYQLIDELKRQQLPSAYTGSAVADVFDSNGDGTTGYFIYTVDQNGGYKQVCILNGLSSTKRFLFFIFFCIYKYGIDFYF